MRQRLRKKCLGSLWTGFQIPHELVEHERAEVPSFTTLLRPQINRQPWQINCQISDACVPARLPLPRPLPRLFPHRLYLAAWGLLIDGSVGDFVTGGGYAEMPNEWRIRRSVVSLVLLRIRSDAPRDENGSYVEILGTKLISENDRPSRPRRGRPSLSLSLSLSPSNAIKRLELNGDLTDGLTDERPSDRMNILRVHFVTAAVVSCPIGRGDARRVDTRPAALPMALVTPDSQKEATSVV